MITGSSRVVLYSEVDVVRARQTALRLARARGFTARAQARLDLVIAELAMNVIRHARSGSVTITVPDDAERSITVECVDRGPGMELPPPPSGNGLGLGLASVMELADTIEISSTVGDGTCVRVTVRG